MKRLTRSHHGMFGALALAIGVAAMALTGCLDRGQCRDNQQLEIVDPNGAVELRWSEAEVGAVELTVFVETGPGTGMGVWGIEAPAGATLPSGIRYGEHPPNAVTEFGPVALVRGARYTATILSETDEKNLRCADRAEFTH